MFIFILGVTYIAYLSQYHGCWSLGNTQGAKASTAMVLTYFANNILVSALEWLHQRCQHSISKMLNDFEPQSENKCLICDEMVKNFPIFCLISLIFFAYIMYIKQKWRFQGLKWAMFKQNEYWLACLVTLIWHLSYRYNQSNPVQGHLNIR